MEQYPASLTLSELIALERRGIYPLTRVMEEVSLGRGGQNNHQAGQWRLAADRIILLVNLKLVAAKLKGDMAPLKSINAAINSTINGVFNSSEPGDDTPTNLPPWLFHWPGPPPGPYLVAAELMQYANLLNEETAQVEFGEIINTFSARIAGATAGAS
jgi:hypothetical protein